MRRVMGGMVVVVLLVSTPAAQGAQRYASPAGSGTACTRGAPCELEWAYEQAVSNDEVILLPGSYFLTQFLTPGGGENLHVHGDFGAPMPRVIATLSFGSIFLLEKQGHFSDIEIIDTGNSPRGFSCYGNGTIERVRITVTGSSAVGILQDGPCLVRDSVIRAVGSNAKGIQAYAHTNTAVHWRNLTVSASGMFSHGIEAGYQGGGLGGLSADLKNSIVDGETADLYSYGNPNGTGTIFAENSNFDSAAEGSTVVDLGGNQKAPPLFVDSAGGDFRQAPGSPTIDAGIADSFLGTLDLDGNSRVLGGAPDIGAYEDVPPTPPSPAAPPVPVAGQIQSLSVLPKAFRAAGRGEAIASAAKKDKAKKGPAGATVSYSLSAPSAVGFTVERKVSGRVAAGNCVKQTRANRKSKRCTLFKTVKGSFSHDGRAGPNTFKLSGRLEGKALKPGAYRLTGAAGGVSQKAAFRIVK